MASSPYHPVQPIYEISLANQAPSFHDVSADKKKNNVYKKQYDLEEIYEFSSEFARVLSNIMYDLTSLPEVPTLAVVESIFLSPDRKIFVGTLMVILSVIYLFVFMC